MFSSTSEENTPVYKIIDLDNNKLVIPQLSFITTFSNPFYTKRNAEIPQIIAKTALFEIPLIIPFDYIEFAFQYLPHHIRFDPISGEPIARYTLYIVVHNNLPEIKEYRIQNIWIKVIDINTYFNLYTKRSDLNDMKFVYFIFVDFSCWGDIVSQSMKNFNISISGGDTSKRHLLSDVSVRLNFLILIFTGLNLDFVNKHLLFNTVDKKFIAPGSFITKDTDNHFSLNISRLKNNPFSLFRDTQKRSFHSTRSNNVWSINSMLPPSSVFFSYETTYYLKFFNRAVLTRRYSSLTPIKISNFKNSHKPNKISSFLKSIKTIIKENKNDLPKAQRYIEEKWIDIAYDSFDINSTFFKKYNIIFEDAWDTLNYADKKGIFKRVYKELAPFLLDYKYIFLTFSFIITFHLKVKETSLATMIGKNIFYSLFFKNYKEKFTSFNAFCINFRIDNNKMIKLGMTFIEAFSSQLSNQIFERFYDEDEGYYIKINKEYIKNIKENLIINPQSLPMISKPTLWDEKTKGGFLLNNDSEFEKGLVTGSENHSHCLTLNKNVYDTVNYLNSLKFKANIDFINYIQNEGNFILDLYKKNNVDSFLNNMITLDIANVLENISFYLNVNLDWRGRIYTQSFYLDYQGSDFSLAFINFSEGKKLTKTGEFFYYIYGANCYNNDNISKRNFNDRYIWVKNNLDKIYSLDKDFISKAESPALFAVFCLNLIKIKNDPNYIHYTPVFLDATCSGIQHFAAMLLDYRLAYNVNLIKTDNVQDFYNTLIEPINKAINDSWKNDPDLVIFSDIKLSRKELKRLIMTKTYNVSAWGMKDHLKSILDIQENTITYKDKNGNEKKKINNLYYVKATNELGYVLLDQKQLLKLATIIDNNIFNNYPILNSVYIFLTQLANIMIKLELPITWATPLGLQILQHYNLSTIQKVTINFLGKSKNTVLRKWTKNLNTKKQENAIIPNIIHSLDATHLFKIILEWSKDKDKYILPIHDCFGTHPNDMESLTDIIRQKFVEIYVNHDFLQNLLDNMINDLKKHRIEIKEEKNSDDPSQNKNYIVIYKKNKKEKIYFPQIPDKGSLNIYDVLKSIHMVT